jgi:hypothetical protein
LKNDNRARVIIFLCLWIAALAGFLWLILGPGGKHFEHIVLRVFLFGAVTALGASAWRAWKPAAGWPVSVAVAALLGGAIFQLLAAENTSILRNVSNYPFSLGWSEASRYYYASLWLARPLYGVDAAPSVLHATRYLMQAVPFLVPEAPIWLHRLWQVFLFVATSWLTAFLLLRRLSAGKKQISQTPGATLEPWVATNPGTHNRGRWALLTIWAALYLLQAPVYYHLLVVPILILWGFNARHFWRSLFVVCLASIWAGLSRVNWLPMPGLLAAALYMLEIPLLSSRTQSTIRYLIPPALWVSLGTALGFGAQTAYRLFSGNPPEYFGSSFSSDLLWYRLLPSVTDPIGVLPSALLYAFPLGLALFFYVAPRLHSFHFIRWSGLLAMLGVLFAGGLIVSVKIGGGKGLHNLDAFWVLLLVVAGYGITGRFAPDRETEFSGKTRNLVLFGGRWWRMTAGLILALPLGFSLASGNVMPNLNDGDAQKALTVFRNELAPTSEAGGEILFITQRQLLTFGNLPGIRLVPEYETVFLMEMAMGNNQFYLQPFHQYLRDHRFALIIADPQNTTLQGRGHQFGEENDAWVKGVSVPLLCSYYPKVTLSAVNVIIYAPRANSDCPEPSD